MVLVHYGHLVSAQRHDTWQQPNKHAESNYGQVHETGWTVRNNAAFTVTGDES